MARVIPDARAHAREIEKTGFELGVFQVGLGAGVGGTIGIAAAQASAVGRIIFKKDESASSPISLTLGARTGAPARALSDKPIALIDGQLQYQPQSQTLTGSVVSELSEQRMSDGIARAISMASYFAKNAAEADTASWKCTEIEAGFDATVTGDIVMATVLGTGLIRLGFERVERTTAGVTQ